MSNSDDYYELLGVARDASADDIRKAYRQAALKFHPDRNPGDAEAAERFKAATEAYGVLADDDKRARYDQFGKAGVEGGMPDMGGDIFSHFQDLFSDFFGGGARQRGPARGQDVRIEQRLTFQEAFVGCKREVSLKHPAPCEPCGGSGAKPGTSRVRCSTCGGAGQVATQRGFMMFSQSCPACKGAGSTVKSPCDECKGVGQVRKVRKVLVTLPAGIDAGQRLRIPGQGLAGEPGAPPGDLYVDVDIEPSDRFERDGADLLVATKVSFKAVALGEEIEVELPDETKVKVEIPAGTPVGAQLMVDAKGFPRIDGRGRGRGRLIVVVDVAVPTKLSAKAKKLLAEFDAEIG